MAALLLVVAGPVTGQQVEVRVTADSGGLGVPGAITRMYDRSGALVAEGLTGGSGRVLLRGRHGAGFTIRVDAIGFRRNESPGFAVPEQGLIRVVVPVLPAPLMLPDVKVTAESRCSGRFREGSVGEQLWSEITRALEVTRFTQDNRLQPIQVTVFERFLTQRLSIASESVVLQRVTSGAPFASLPAEELVRRGFVFKEADDSLTYAAPDAAILLADPFVRTHCYRVVLPSTSADSLLGLAFEPVEDRNLPDVQGVLWVDRKSSELRFLEYRYTRLEGRAAFTNVGGRVEFRRLPTGTWIVSDWYVRMPRVYQILGDMGGIRYTRDSLLGYVDRAGRAEPVATVRTVSRPPATLTGVLYDSLAMAPLVGAEVRVGGAPTTTRSDSAGRFRVSVPEPEERVVTIRHPRLGLVSDRSVQSVRFYSGREATITAAVPVVGAFVSVFCPGITAGEAGVLGIVYADGAPAEGVAVQASWTDASRPGQSRLRGRDTRTGGRGLYALCDLPAGVELRLEMVLGTRAIEVAKVTLPKGEFRWFDLAPP